MSKYLARSLTGLAVIAMVVTLTSPLRAEDTKPKKPMGYGGTITAIDAKADTVTVQKKEGDSKTFTCAPTCKFGSKEDKATSLADYKVGDKITVHYLDEGGKSIAQKLSMWRAPHPK